jgi:hypothetical protein
MTKEIEKLRKRLIKDYKAEHAEALKWKRQGQAEVSATTAGSELAVGREKVPIDEYIKMWQDGLTALEGGADPEKYNY